MLLEGLVEIKLVQALSRVTRGVEGEAVLSAQHEHRVVGAGRGGAAPRIEHLVARYTTALELEQDRVRRRARRQAGGRRLGLDRAAAAVDGCRQVAGESATHAVEAARSATVDDARREAKAAASLAADRLFTEQRAAILQDASKAAAQLAASAALEARRASIEEARAAADRATSALREKTSTELEALEWLMKKQQLRQDVFLLGPPGPHLRPAHALPRPTVPMPHVRPRP